VLSEQIAGAVRARLERSIAEATLREREQIAQEIGAVMHELSGLRGHAAEHALRRLLRGHLDGPALLRALTALLRSAPMPSRPAPPPGAGRVTLEALLLLVPPSRHANASGAAPA
jgi:hypothetical protein